MGMLFLCWGLLYAIVVVCMYVVKHLDTENWNWTEKERGLVLVGSGINSVIIRWLSHDCLPKMEFLCLMTVLAGCLVFACVTDCQSCQVFAFTWWGAGAVGGILLFQSLAGEYGGMQLLTAANSSRLASLFLYIILQESFFSRYYGRADCHAFVACAIAECALGMGMPEYLLHMTLAFGGLAMVQGFRGNINSRGNLKQPVAFLPYITISFWVLLFLGKNVILNQISETNLLGG